MAQKPLPFSRDEFRYHWAEDDEPLCSDYIRELNFLEASKRNQVASYIKRKIIPTIVKLSETDRAPQLKISDDCYRVTGEKGYSMIRATCGANRGKYYFEIHINSMPDNSATRVGWGQCYANLQAPLGYDHFGYSYRSRYGTKFHQASGKSYDESGGYKAGDTIGCMIELPHPDKKRKFQSYHLPESIKNKEVGFLMNSKKKDAPKVMLEEVLKPVDPNKLEPLEGSKISFYKNGNFIGVAFRDIFEGYYYPSISLYKNCVVTANFGPKFKCPPEEFNPDSSEHLNYEPAQNMANMTIVDNCLSDILFVVSKEVDCDEPVLNEISKRIEQNRAKLNHQNKA